MNVKLLKDLDFANKINSVQAVTEAGKELLNNYRAYCYSNAPSCGLVNGFVSEASKFSFDSGLVSVLESVKAYINENNISWRLASVCESIVNNNSSQAYISKVAVDKVQKLLEMSEGDVVSYIKAGVLKDIQYVPEFRMVCRDVYKTRINEAQAVNYNIVNPVSFVYVTENKDQYFQIYGHTYKISEGKVSEAQCDDKQFVAINRLLESFQKEGENIFVEMKMNHGTTARFTIMNESDQKLVFTNGAVKEEFNSASKFLEYANMVSRTLMMNEKLNFMNVCKNVATLFEAADNIVTLDCAKIMSCNNGTILGIIEGKDNVNLTVFQSVNAGSSSNNYDYVVEALNNVVKLTGIDLKPMFEDRINEDAKKAPEYDELSQQLAENKSAQMDIRKKKIAMLAEQFKNDPLRISMLNKIAKDIALLED